MAEVTDPKSLEHWLESRELPDAQLVASRIALRVLPDLARQMDLWHRLGHTFEKNEVLLKKLEGERRRVVLPVLRKLLAVHVAANLQSSDRRIGEALEAAASGPSPGYMGSAVTDAMTVAGNGHIFAAAYAASSAETALRMLLGPTERERAYRLTYAAINEDLEDLAAGRKPTLLWPIAQVPEEVFSCWKALRAHLLNDAEDEQWQNWVRWYDGVLHNEPEETELELQKARIANEIWDQGPLAVNLEIQRLTTEFRTQRTSAQPSALDTFEFEPVQLEKAATTVAANPITIFAMVSDLQDRIAAELNVRMEERRNDPDAETNLNFLRELEARVSMLSATAAALPSNPTEQDVQPVVEKAWNLLDQTEKYCVWIAGEENARKIASGVLIGGFLVLAMSLGQPVPAVATVVKSIGGDGIKSWLKGFSAN